MDELKWLYRQRNEIRHTTLTPSIFFMSCLSFSPSYELARKSRQEGLSSTEKKSLPKDFSKVLKTFDKFGDVSKQELTNWELSRMLPSYVGHISEPRVRLITDFETREKVSQIKHGVEVANFLSHLRENIEGRRAMLVVSLPLAIKKSELLRQISELLLNYDLGKDDLHSIKPSPFLGKKFPFKHMVKLEELFETKLEYPDYENWRIGSLANFSKTLEGKVDAHGPKHSPYDEERKSRIAYGKVVSRALNRYERIIENAARGRFPCDDPILYEKFDYSEIAHRAKAYSMWLVKNKRKNQKTLKDLVKKTYRFMPVQH